MTPAFAAAGVLAIVALGSGCGTHAAASKPHVGPPVTVERHDPARIEAEITGATAAQERVLREILSGVKPAHVSRVRVEPVEPGWEPFPDGAVQIVVSGRADSEAVWERTLVAGAFIDRSHELGLATVEVFGADGGGESRAGARSGVPAPDATDVDDSPSAATTIAKAAAEAGATVEEIRIMRPWGPALAVTLRVEDPAAFLARRFERYRAATSEVDRDFPDGSLLQVLDEDGELVVMTAGAERASTYLTYSKPDLAGCVFLGESRPAGYEPPPCPVAVDLGA